MEVAQGWVGDGEAGNGSGSRRTKKAFNCTNCTNDGVTATSNEETHIKNVVLRLYGDVWNYSSVHWRKNGFRKFILRRGKK